MNDEMCVDCRKMMAPTEEAYLVENGAICRMCKLRRTSSEIKSKTRMDFLTDVVDPDPAVQGPRIQVVQAPNVQVIEKSVFRDRVLIHRVENAFGTGFTVAAGVLVAFSIFLAAWWFLADQYYDYKIRAFREQVQAAIQKSQETLPGDRGPRWPR